MMAILVNGDPAVPTDVTRVMSEIDDLDLVVASGDSMGNLLEAAQDAGVKRFVFSHPLSSLFSLILFFLPPSNVSSFVLGSFL